MITLPERVEASFSLPNLAGNPFDYTQNDVRATIQAPDGSSVQIPAFFDGGTAWRVRYHPAGAGRYTVTALTRNGSPIPSTDLAPRTFSVAGNGGAGFVRRDLKNDTRLVFDSGAAYYPIGNDAAWGKGDNPAYLLGILDKMGASGENWTRIWMNHWDGKNLDWQTGLKGAFDQLDLQAARQWDRIIETAEKDGLYVQVTLQHHGPYSTRVNSNWGENPWNRKNGGFLDTPGEFFTNPRARALTKAKYRYIIARWGYSPHILAWELFNEVQWCDPIYDKNSAIVLAWHREMAAFLREQDPNHHLVTTSSDTHIAGLYDGMDYVQPHAYPPDAVTAVTADDPVYHGKPYFFGEVGPGDDKVSDDAKRRFLHDALWGSFMSRSAGAAQFWYWDEIDNHDFYPVLRAAAAFTRAATAETLTRTLPVAVKVATPDTPGTTSAGPGTGWGVITHADLSVNASGEISGISELPSFLQGMNHRDMGTTVNFHVDYGVHAGTFTVTLKQVSKAGGHLVLSVDGNAAANRDYPGGDADRAVTDTLSVSVPAGKHIVRVENTGTDWLVIDHFTLSPYGSALRALAKADRTHAVLWLCRTSRDSNFAAVVGQVTLPGLAPGRYRIHWWDTTNGRESGIADATAAPGRDLSFTTPPVSGDVAAYVTPSR